MTVAELFDRLLSCRSLTVGRRALLAAGFVPAVDVSVETWYGIAGEHFSLWTYCPRNGWAAPVRYRAERGRMYGAPGPFGAQVGLDAEGRIVTDDGFDRRLEAARARRLTV